MSKSRYRLFLSFILITILFACADEYLVIDKEDMSLLYVINTIPKNNSTNIARDLSPAGAVIINFSKELDEKYVSKDYFNFTCNELEVDSKISLSDDKKTVSIKLKQGTILPEGAFCRVVISKQIQDSYGLPFYLSENSISSPLITSDAGFEDAIDTNMTSEYKERRTGEGDYILRFVTEYEPLKIISIKPEDKSIIKISEFSSFEGIEVGFNKPLNPDTINISNFIIAGEPIELNLSEDSKIVTIKLLNGLRERKTYNLRILPFVSDNAGILLNDTYIFSFETEYLTPIVVSIDPPNGDQAVNHNLTSIKVEFNKDMNPLTINNYTINLTDVENYTIRYKDKVAYIENLVLKENRDYVLTISSQIEDVSGFLLDKTYYSHFRTSLDHPYVKSVFPDNDAKDVPLSLASIDIEFSEEMNFDNIDNSMFEIDPFIPFSIKIRDNKSIQLLLSETLVSKNTYKITIKDYLMDTSNIRMEKPFSFSFTTTSTPDNNLPSDLVIYSKRITNPEEDRRKGFIIEWKAPGSDVINGKLSGKVKGYSLVYSDKPFDKSNFSGMRELANLPTPANPDEIQSITLYSFIDKENNEEPIIYNKTYYFMLRATDGTNFVYSNLLGTGILIENKKIYQGSKFFGLSLKYIQNFNKEKVFAIGDTDDIENGKVLGSVTIAKLENNSSLKELFKIYGKSENSLFGYQIESADLNNDGCDELIVSAPLDGRDREGAVYIYSQVKNGLDCIFNQQEPIKISGGLRESMFGLSISKLIMNKKEHLVVGAPQYGSLNTGAVFIYFNRDNISEIPDGGDIVITGKISGSSFGYSIKSGDLNSDGCEDLIISAPDNLTKSRGSVYVLYSSSSPSGCLIQNTDINNADMKIDGELDFERLGYNLYTTDLNGDSNPELILSGRDEINNSGFILIRDTANGKTIKIKGEEGGNFGFYIQSASDFRRDGCGNELNNKCRDLFISDERLSKIYLLEGRESISNYDFNDLIVFDNNKSVFSTGYSFAIFTEGAFESLLVSAPFVRNFNDYISEIYIYR